LWLTLAFGYHKSTSTVGTSNTAMRSLLATMLGVLVGGFVAFCTIVIVLEALHTKDAFINLSVFAIGAGLGGFTAIGLRRYLLSAELPRTGQSVLQETSDEENAS
jgi:hypothetical protein